MPSESLEERIKQMEEDNDRLRQEIVRLQAIQEIKNVMGKYQVYHTPRTFWKTPELFALKQPDVSVEIAMWGVYTGAEQVKAVYQRIMVEPIVGTMFEHDLTTSMIEVAGDGQTAKGVWFSPGHETPIKDKKHQAHWCWGKYACDFIKEDGEWKIWHMHFYDSFMCTYYQSWVDIKRPRDLKIADINPVFAEYPPDKPTTFRTSYNTESVRETIPPCPEPYDTWDGKSIARP